MENEPLETPDVEEAKARFKAVAQGRHIPSGISVEEAKKRLRETDPGIDISDMLRAFDQGDPKKAGMAFFMEAVTDPSVITYWSPLLIGLIQALIPSHKRS